jgi:6-phosphogluconolactonase
VKRLLVLALCACDGSSPAPATDADVPGDDVIDAAPTPTKFIAYVSGGANIDWYDVNKTTGAFTPISSMAAFRTNASFLAFRGTTHVYAVASQNRVGAYSIDQASGALTFINDVAAGGNGPTHVSVDRTGAYVFVANYGGGNVSVFPVQPNGGLGAATQTVASGAMAHLIDVDASNKYVFVPCLGANYVAQYLFDASTGMLTPNTPPTLPTAAGAGPRHLAIAPNQKHAYLINELNSTLSALAFDSTTGRLSEIHTVTTRAAGAAGNNTTAEVVVHPSGKFVYGSNRGDDNIVAFALDGTTGRMTLIGHQSTQGMTPRNFTIDPSGKFLYAANQNSGSVVPFAIDPATGALARTAQVINVPTPQFVGILPLPE